MRPASGYRGIWKDLARQLQFQSVNAATAAGVTVGLSNVFPVCVCFMLGRKEEHKQVACPLRISGEVLPHVVDVQVSQGLAHKRGKDGA